VCVSVDESGREDESEWEEHREKRWRGRLCERNGEREGRTQMRVVREDESEREKHVEKGRDRVVVEERKGRIEQERGEEGGQKRREGGREHSVFGQQFRGEGGCISLLPLSVHRIHPCIYT